jgi:hypothetical protein
MSVTVVGSRSLRFAKRGARRPRNRRGEAIRMEVKRFEYFPQTFVWHGKRYDVHAVEQCWTVSRRWVWDVERHCFRVRCAEGTFELYQDAKRNTWHVDHFERGGER